MLKKLLGMSLLLTFSVVIALVVAEIGLRIAHIGYPALGGKLHFYTWNPYTGVSLRPDAKGMVYGENTVYSSINHAGFRDRDHNKAKPPNTFRVAVLGDSFAEAAQVDEGKAFWTVMEHDLGGCPGLGGRTVEVMNFGVSGYGTAQELQMLRHYVWDYSPDVVLLAFFTGNDVQNNNRILQDDMYRPYFVHHDGKLVLDDAFLHAPGWKSQFNSRHVLFSWAIAHSRVLQVAAAAKNYFGSKNVAGVKPTEMGLDDSIYHPPTDSVWQDAWSVTDDLIGVMNEEVKAHQAQLLVTTLSSSIQVDPDSSDRDKLEKRLGISNLFYPDYRVKKVAEADGADTLTLAPDFLEYAQQHHVQLHGFRGSRQGHWNELGHQLGGHMMAQKVCEMVSTQPNSAAPEINGTVHGVSGGLSW